MTDTYYYHSYSTTVEPSTLDTFSAYHLVDQHQPTNLVLELRGKIAERQRLSGQIKDTLQTMIVDLDNKIIRVKLFKPQSPALIERRTSLEQEILRCQQAELEEEHRCWTDISRLETELRDALRQESVLRPQGYADAGG